MVVRFLGLIFEHQWLVGGWSRPIQAGRRLYPAIMAWKYTTQTAGHPYFTSGLWSEIGPTRGLEPISLARSRIRLGGFYLDLHIPSQVAMDNTPFEEDLRVQGWSVRVISGSLTTDIRLRLSGNPGRPKRTTKIDGECSKEPGRGDPLGLAGFSETWLL